MPGELLTDGLRVVEVNGYDATACGGTHVARTGEIGLIKVLKLERRGDKTRVGDKMRVEFCCGGRALRDFQLKNGVVNNLSALLTCGADEVGQAVERLRENLKETQRALKAANKTMMDYEIAALLAEAGQHEGFRVVKAAFEGRDVGELRRLANSLTEGPGVVALLGALVDGKGYVLLARSDDLKHDMNVLLQRVLPILNDARGGGRPNSAQGGGVKADLPTLEFTLSEAERVIVSEEA